MNYYESDEQKTLILWSKHVPELREFLIASANGGKRNPREAARLKKEGVRAGVHDLLLPIPRDEMHGLWIEFKAARPNDAEYRKNQKLWEIKMREQGYAAFCCRGFDEAKIVFEWYLSLPKVKVPFIPTIEDVLEHSGPDGMF